MTPTNKAGLSAARKKLIDIMQRTNFGRVEHLRVRDGEPQLDPRPRVVKTIKLAGANAPRLELAIEDFALKREVRDLFEHLDDIRNGVVPVIDIRHGLPMLMEVEENSIE